jgi:hypothetical protein
MMSNTGLRILCCNAFKNIHDKCKCVYSCKIFEQKNDSREFKCEITNKVKNNGSLDCSCENKCIVTKSEIKIIEDSDISNK